MGVVLPLAIDDESVLDTGRVRAKVEFSRFRFRPGGVGGHLHASG